MLEEITTNITVLNLGKIILDSLLIFVFFYLFVVLFNLSVYYALVPCLLFFGISLFYDFQKNKYLVVEQGFPDLNERLRTVADYADKSNPILDLLKQDVLRDIRKVKMSKFIDYKWMIVRILSLTMLSIIVVILAYSNVSFGFSLGDLPIIGDSSLGVREAGDNLTNTNLSFKTADLNNILGNESLAILGNEELQLKVNPLQSNTDLDDIGDVLEQEFRAPTFPKEIYTSYDLAYQDNIAKNQREVVKNYFQQIAR